MSTTLVPPGFTEMRCVEVSQPGGPEVLCLAQRAIPVPAEHEVLIRVDTAGVNRGDTVQRAGRYPPPPGASDLLGLEVSGHIVAVGPWVQRWREGDAVCALLPGGGYAEYCVAHADLCLPVPASVPLAAAAALPEACFTVWTMVWQLGRLGNNETLLVHGGTSGVGTLAIQMASALGHRVYATAGSPEKCALCVSLGAAAAVDYRQEDFVERLRDLTQGRGVDVVLDMIGGEYVNRDMKILNDGGRIVLIAFQGGRTATFDIAHMMMRRITITGATLRARPIEFKAEIARALEARVWPIIESGGIRPVIDQIHVLENAAAAHIRMASGEGMGKILLSARR